MILKIPSQVKADPLVLVNSSNNIGRECSLSTAVPATTTAADHLKSVHDLEDLSMQ